MMVTLTPHNGSEIKKYKKFLEKEEIFNYPYRYEGVEYNYVIFKKLGKVTASLVLTEDKGVSRNQMVHAGWAFFHFNRVIVEARIQLIPDINRPILVLQEGKKQLRKAEWNPDFKMSPFQEEIRRLYEVLDTGLKVKEKLHNILLDMQALEKKMLERGYLIDEDTEQMIGFNIDHYRTMYHQGKEIIRSLPTLKKLKAHVEKLKGSLAGEDEHLRQSLYVFLDAFTADKTVEDLLSSNESFEKDEWGDPVQMLEGEAGLRQYEAKLRKEVEHIYETEIVKDIRNLPEDGSSLFNGRKD
ncbi:hypothetical protein [Paenibacillus eucommiae]|uniref:Uncharacterized protein n=1 Tax=Paenibacillus eucommiae TaxID=1355755 RepID=A0ABS4IVQ4_9BACL|nr:hypothetical protein [Paenibacillus eucommiae]MBP1991677.1 hypothetical protein [Paenibacillus eucommiae]